MADFQSSYAHGAALDVANVAGSSVTANTVIIAADNQLNPLTGTNLASTGIKAGSVDLEAAIEKAKIQMMDYIADN